MRSGPANNSQHTLLTRAQLEEQQQALLLRELGLNWPVQSLLQSTSRGNFQQQQSDFVKQFLKPQHPQSSFTNIQQQQRELTPKRPSLIQDFGSNMPQNSRYSLIQPHLQQAQIQSNKTGISPSSDTSYLTEEEEKCKRFLFEKLEKIDREKTQSAAMQKNAEKKAKACERLLAKASQEPSFMAAMDNDENDDNYESRDGQSSTDALINRIYAENRRKAAAANPIPPLISAEENRQLMKEDTIRLKEEYERGLQLLPDLIKAMRIQRDKRQDIVEQKKIVYEEQLTIWEKKVNAHEKNKKKLVRDGKHREIFEKTFVELRKMREEKERSNRGVERIRFSLTQGGIANIPPLTSSLFAETQNVTQMGEEQMEIDQDEDKQETCGNKQSEIDEKVVASCVVPPVYTNRPRRFFDNRNGIVENALSDSRAQLEAFQIAWSDSEKAVFNEKIAVYGKNFAAISAFLPLKSVKDCVYFYYMTKKRNNYKAKFGRRRKKLGRQGYRPPVMPRFGDTNENLENYGRSCTFVECLLCDSRILVLESLAQRHSHQFEEFSANISQGATFGGSMGSEDLLLQQEKHHQEMPICTKCQTLAQRNRTLNRCPLGSCVCVGGKRKMKPSRNIPDKFGTLNADKKRFLINRLKMPPTSNKCCTNCFKKISKDIEDLLLGELQSEFDVFLKRSTVGEERLVEEEELLGEQKVPEGIGINEVVWPLEGQPPFKELKLDEEAEIDEETKSLMKLKKELDDQEEKIQNERPPLGSITKGTPNRSRSLLIETSLASLAQSSTINTFTTEATNINLLDTSKQQIIQDLLAKFSIANSNNDTAAATELSFQINKLLETFPIELLFDNFQQQPQVQQQQNFEEIKLPKEVVEVKEEKIAKQTEELPCINLQQQQQQIRPKKVVGNDILRRKSGLANVLLPSPVATSSESSVTSTNIRGISNSFSSSTTRLLPTGETENLQQPPQQPFTASIPSIIEKPVLEQQQTTNLTIKTLNEISFPNIPKAESTQDHLSSCYESLSDDSDDEREKKQNQKQQQKQERQQKNNGDDGMEVSKNPIKITTQQIQQLSTTSTDKPTPISTPLPTFMSLFDLMYEGNEEKVEEEECLQQIAGTSCNISPQSTTTIISQQQQQPTISNFFQTIPTTKISENKTNEGGGEGCLYEPLSSDDET
uniref:SANT domain-containing protein n=1 Tax=Meloidogyne incognita TaxID=6306 RepID=A0A914N799_MELIC